MNADQVLLIALLIALVSVAAFLTTGRNTTDSSRQLDRADARFWVANIYINRDDPAVVARGRFGMACTPLTWATRAPGYCWSL